MSIRSYSWLLPFVTFSLGYVLIALLVPQSQVQTPHLVGLPLNKALMVASQAHLPVTISAEKIDATLPEGTILHQSPFAGSLVKEFQTISCVISRLPEQLKAPHLLNLHKDEITKQINQMGIKTTIIYGPHTNRKDTCFAQYPAPGESIPRNESLVIYLADGVEKQVIWPDFNGKTMDQAADFFMLHGIKPSITHSHLVEPNHSCGSSCIITDQRPHKGAFVRCDTLTGSHIFLQLSDPHHSKSASNHNSLRRPHQYAMVKSSR